MSRSVLIPVLGTLVLFSVCSAQVQEENLSVDAEHPRLLLGQRRLRLLRKERERQSMRWLQFEQLMAGKAPMPEPGFADALYYLVSGDDPAGRRAVDWALGSGSDLRQLSLVFDWCQPILSPAQVRQLAAKLQNGIEQNEGNLSVTGARNRMFAAVALAGTLPEVSEREIDRLMRTWWNRQMLPALKQGRQPIPRGEMYALFELLHVVRDNLNLDLRESVPKYFKELPIYDLLTYYPATYPAGENDYRIPASDDAGEPDLRRAALARAADLSMVSYDVNAPESQFLQGWLMHDHFLMRGPFGIPYEFLWANPYQPGLSYYHVPLVYHDDLFGRLLVRSDWDETATWLGYFHRRIHLFRDGKPSLWRANASAVPIEFPAAVIFLAGGAARFQVSLKEHQQAFVLGLKPGGWYELEVDQEEMTEQQADPGGILALDLPRKGEVGFRLREAANQNSRGQMKPGEHQK